MPEDPGWVQNQLDLLGLKPSDPNYDMAKRLAQRSVGAWAIAKRLGCSPDFVEQLKWKS